MANLIYLIPAYQPSEELLELVNQLRSQTGEPILIVNDGSGADWDNLFEKLACLPNIQVLRHYVNLGKGAALKTLFNYALVHFPQIVGSVSLDADGQHRAGDAVEMGRWLCLQPQHLVLGCREFGQQHKIPLRSRFGNQVTQKVFRFLTGVNISDTQTGLRGIPKSLMSSMLRVSSSGYDFETNMLIAAVQQGIGIKEYPIPTIYINENEGSHFNPLLDSIRIYFVFIRFAFVSLVTAFVDFLVFALAHSLTGSLLTASISGRIVAGTLNFLVSKRLVFLSKGRVLPEALRYGALVAFFLFLSNSAISVLVRHSGMNVYLSKFLVETALFLISFTAQRLIIFPVSTVAATAKASASASASASVRTNWDAYYQRPFKASSITRKITTRRILDCLRDYGGDQKDPVILELGGGNSCVYRSIVKGLQPRKYVIIDNNRIGLNKFTETYSDAQSVDLIEGDVLDLQHLPQKADICFSIGLIEHFSKPDTQKAVHAHFDCIGPEGLVLITFPTPTWLYQITRTIAETLNLWQFPDERPCTMKEVVTHLQEKGEILHSSIIWPIFLTQGVIVARPLGKSG